MVKKKIKVGITGQNGFIGSHLYNFLGLQENVQRIEFEKYFFDDTTELERFVTEVDVIVHLAAKNRDQNPQVIFDTNIALVRALINACEKTNSKPYILFASSTQEENHNLYGDSKRRGRELLELWASKSGGLVTGLIIPNVFGPFGKPFYNSVVATFCHQITRKEEPIVINDGVLNLVYINELVEDIWDLIVSPRKGKILVKARYKILVSELLLKLKSFKDLYLVRGEIPNLDTAIDLALFSTFRCYVPNDFFPFALTKHTDNRGSFVEILRANSRGQYSYSTTVKGITRGNHFHTRKVERFAVISGKASIQLRRIGTKEIVEYILDGENPSFVDMPIWHTHSIKNIGDKELVTLFWINEPYNPEDADTYFEEV